MDIHPKLGANYLSLTAWSHVDFSISIYYIRQWCCETHLLMACSSSVMPVSLNARFDSSRLRAIALCRSSLSSPVRSTTSTLRKYTQTDKYEDYFYRHGLHSNIYHSETTVFI